MRVITMNEYISVSEFAKLVQKSPQSIYKQLNNRLNPYVKLVDNQKMLNTRALTEIYGIEVEQPIQPELTTYSTTDSTQDNQLIALLQQTQSILKKQLEEKDKLLAQQGQQITDLLRKLDDKEEKINVLTGVNAQALLQATSTPPTPAPAPFSPEEPTPPPVTGFKAWVITKFGRKV